MKKMYIFFAFFFLSIQLFSQIPQTISWQGIVQDGQGNNLNGEYNITVSLFAAASGGSALWTEVHQAVNAQDGLVNIELGSVTPFNITFDKAFWLEVQVGTANPMPRLKLSSVPYALFAEKSSGAIINDSLVLKDSRGVTRMVLNPNTGTFKMMNDDTVWYSLSVNSPADEVIHLPDGGRIEKYHDYLNTMGSSSHEKYYNADGQLTEHKTHTNGAMGSEENCKVYENGSLVREYGSGGALSSQGHTFYNYTYQNGEKVKEEITKKNTFANTSDAESETKDIYINGTKTSTEITYVNGDKRIITYQNGNEVTNVLNKASGKSVTSNANSPDFTWNTYQSNTGWYTGKYFETPGGPTVGISSQDYGASYQMQYQAGFLPGSSVKLGSDNVVVSGGGSGSINLASPTTINANGTVNGNFTINGNLNVNGTKNFRIAHPDDPENKYLVHAAIESDQVLNKYIGTVKTDSKGNAIVTLPDYVEKVNKNFHYQLTVIGEFAQAIISKKIANNQFEIKTDKPNVEVSWEITGERNDKFMREHPFEPIIKIDKNDQVNDN